MLTRQFKRFASISKARRVELVVEGLRAIGDNVVALAEEIERCNQAEAYRAARLVYNVGREEAGKFLILMDPWRAPDSDQKVIAAQFERAGVHLAKLIYAQIAEYSLADQAELLRAVRGHRRGLYLDGPNDYDWIFRNDLLWERESAMYVDLVDSEGSLEWWTPTDYRMAVTVPFSMRLVSAVLGSGLASDGGLQVLAEAWNGFDATTQSHSSEWRRRNLHALTAFPDQNVRGGQLTREAAFIVQQWPMPMVELDLKEEVVSIETLHAERQKAYDSWAQAEIGDVY